MNRLKILLALSILFWPGTKGQNAFNGPDKITIDDFEPSRYEKYRDDEAVVIFDKGQSYFVESGRYFNVVFEKHIRTRILSGAGIRWAEERIPLYQEANMYEQVVDVDAVTYNIEHGAVQKTPLDPSTIYEEKINESWIQKKFAMPDVRAGSIIDVSYKIKSPYIFNFHDWEFQKRIPVMYSEYQVKLIPFYEYTWILQGADKFDVFQSYEDKGMPRHFGSTGAYSDNTYYDMVYTFGMKDVPAFEDEEYITSINDYILKIDFQLAKTIDLKGVEVDVITTWDKMIKSLLKSNSFGKYTGKSEKLTDELIDAGEIAGLSEREKFNYVVDYVKSTFDWDQEYWDYDPKSPKDLVIAKACGDNYMLVYRLYMPQTIHRWIMYIDAITGDICSVGDAVIIE